MSTTSLTWLTRTAVALGILELLDSIVIRVEDYPGGQPLFAVLFGLLFLGAAWLLTRRATAGAVVTAALCVFELVSFPSWERRNAFDWVSQVLFAVLALAGLLLAVLVVVRRRERVATP